MAGLVTNEEQHDIKWLHSFTLRLPNMPSILPVNMIFSPLSLTAMHSDSHYSDNQPHFGPG
jgi:hypothetical protein